MKDKNEQQMPIQVDNSLYQGSYSNLAVISHSSTEFVLDFASRLPGGTAARVNNRIIMSPEHTKRLLYALAENIRGYEAEYGNIAIDGKPTGTWNAADMLSRGGTKS